MTGDEMFPRRGFFDRTTFGRLFGVSRHVVERWEMLGLIRPSGVLAARRHGYTWLDALRFAHDPATWHLWEVEEVADARMYEIARARRGDVAWVPVPAAAAGLGYTKFRVEQLCRFGVLDGLAELRHERWYLRADRMDEVAGRLKAVGVCRRRRVYTPEERARIREMRAAGATFEAIARAVGLSSTGSSQSWAKLVAA